MRILAAWMVALCLFIFSCAASGEPAQEDKNEQQVLKISFFVKPSEMVGPGEAMITFTIENPSEFDIQNVYLASSDGTRSEPIGQIDAGESQDLVRSHVVTQEELDAGILAYVISHDPLIDGGDKIIYPVNAEIVKAEALPKVDFTRQISSGYVNAGNQATITYKIRNTGNVDISNIRIRDTLGDFTGRAETLEIGETKTFISRVTISADSASAPELEYTVPSGETVSRNLDKAPIRISDNRLDMSFSVGESVFSMNSVDALLTLSNPGNTDYTDISILDDVHGGTIADSISLPSGGEPVEISHIYPMRGASDYRWRIIGTNESGEEINLLTETHSIRERTEIDDISVSINAAPRVSRINRPGYITFDIGIRNSGSHMAQDLLLYEVARGEVRKLAVLPTGEPTRCSVNYEITEDSQFIFCLNYTDENGNPRTVSAAPITIEIAPDGETPFLYDDTRLDLEGGSAKMKPSSIFTVLLVSVASILLILFVILLITSSRVRRERRAREAAERQRIKEEMGKTNPFTPLKYARKDKK